MARLSRFFVPGQPLHAIQRGNNREAIFAAPEDYRHFLEFLHDGAKRYACAVHAYVLMTNHLHLLVTPAKARGKADPVIVPHSVYRRLAKDDVARQGAYRQLFRAHLSHVDLESIRETLHKGWALGNPRFRAKIETLSGRRASPLPQGRPRGKDNRV